MLEKTLGVEKRCCFTLLSVLDRFSELCLKRIPLCSPSAKSEKASNNKVCVILL